MKRMLLLCLIFLLFISCNETDDYPDVWTPPYVTDVTFSPKQIKCNEELTVTFTVGNIIGDERAKAWNNATINDNFQIVDSLGYISNYLVRFNMCIPQSVKPIFQCAKNGGIEVIYLDILDDAVFENAISPEKYTLLKISGDANTKEINVELRCIIPTGVKSSVIKIEAGNTRETGFSDQKLVIVDENGNEVTE